MSVLPSVIAAEYGPRDRAARGSALIALDEAGAGCARRRKAISESKVARGMIHAAS